jgi:hypothetical protein
MNPLSDLELTNTRRKLRELESLCQSKSAETGGDAELREITLESLRRLIKQLKEEIIRSEVRTIAS